MYILQPMSALLRAHPTQCQAKSTCTKSRYAVDTTMLPIITGKPTLW